MARLAGIRLDSQRMDIVAVLAFIERMLRILADIFLSGVFISTLGGIAEQSRTGCKLMDILETDAGIDSIKWFRRKVIVDRYSRLAALVAFKTQIGVNGYQITFCIFLRAERQFCAIREWNGCDCQAIREVRRIMTSRAGKTVGNRLRNYARYLNTGFCYHFGAAVGYVLR